MSRTAFGKLAFEAPQDDPRYWDEPDPVCPQCARDMRRENIGHKHNPQLVWLCECGFQHQDECNE